MKSRETDLFDCGVGVVVVVPAADGDDKENEDETKMFYIFSVLD